MGAVENTGTAPAQLVVLAVLAELRLKGAVVAVVMGTDQRPATVLRLITMAVVVGVAVLLSPRLAQAEQAAPAL